MWALSIVCAIALISHLVSIAVAARRIRKAAPTATDWQIKRPPVSILRPVCGLENNLAETLESTFHLDWPEVEIIFCVAATDDPAIPLVERLIAAHPDVAARLLVGDVKVSVNPKLNNVVKGWNAACHDWIVLADSNVLAPSDYLDRLFARWLPGTGMVCSPPAGSAPEGFWAEVECVWLNSFQARWQLVADEIGFGFGQGKTMLMQRSLLDASGGIESLAEEVAEDAAATKIVRTAGLCVRLTIEPFQQPLGRRSWGGIWRRQLRWARLRRASFPLYFAPEILSGGALPMLSTAVLVGFGDWPLWAGLLYAALWYGSEILLTRLFRWPLSLRTPAALLLRDAALPALWAAAWFGNGFVWRGNQMAVPPARHRRDKMAA
ncbi:glycosyltransferase [Agrobacterium sp. a22-2]|uniref:ceramide glucosyltransferase n=1 Tax=Agrobacterium sp. a22-2 TaxID=2283840 RepID=UPI001445697D|nr:ceramide glucosyltransferase [Agrobacterium sp. a22-2]NKN35634.1 glycosyltransferase [Agrobacterium sp. a22-2]